jgi:hypothetical protein
MKKENEIKEAGRSRFGIWQISCFILLLVLAGVSWKVYGSNVKIKELNLSLKKVSAEKKKVEKKQKKVVFAASVLSELQGWKNAPPFASTMIKGLGHIPSGLSLKKYSLTRYFSIYTLNKDLIPKRLPHPIRVVYLSDSFSIDIDEVKKGSGIDLFDQFKDQLEKKTEGKLEFSRVFSSEEEEKNPTEKASWIIFGEGSKIPLWKGSIK